MLNSSPHRVAAGCTDNQLAPGEILGRSLAISNLVVPSRVFLAPLSGVSDLPFRRLVRRFGVGIAYSEMIASSELLRGSSESLRRAMADGSGQHAVQLAGRDPADMRSAAALLVAEGAHLIDINFGCPAKKVTGGLCGSALMREPELAVRLVEAAVEGAGDVPVTVKMRLGWDDASRNAPDLAAAAERAGARLVTVHGRTRQQFYDGRADWTAIACVGSRIGVPLVANGDLVDVASVPTMLQESGADALMIGRGTYGRPWFPGLLAGAVSRPALARISFGAMVAEHYEAMLDHYGIAKGLRHARKHIGWYLDRFVEATGSELTADRVAILSSTDARQVLRQLTTLLGDISIDEIEPVDVPAVRKAA